METNINQVLNDMDWDKISDDDLNSMYRQSMRGVRSGSTEDSQGRKTKRIDSMQFSGSEWDALGMTNIDHLHYGHDGSRTGYDDQQYYVDRAFDGVQKEYQRRLDEKLANNEQETEEEPVVTPEPDRVISETELSDRTASAQNANDIYRQALPSTGNRVFNRDPAIYDFNTFSSVGDYYNQLNEAGALNFTNQSFATDFANSYKKDVADNLSPGNRRTNLRQQLS